MSCGIEISSPPGSSAAVEATQVVGPASATDNAITRFDGTTGKIIQNSGVLIDDTGHIAIIAGTVGAPSIAPTGDSNTGIYSSAADTLDISTGGTNRLSINGTAVTAGVKVLIPDGTLALPGLAFSSQPAVGIARLAANEMDFMVGAAYEFMSIVNAVNNGHVRFEVPLRSNVTDISTPSYGHHNDADTGMYFPSNDNIGMVTGGVSRLNINSSAVNAIVPISVNSLGTITSAGVTDPVGTTAEIAISSISQDNAKTMSIFTANNSAANANGTMSLNLLTGNVSGAGTGESGVININTGSSTGTVSGAISVTTGVAPTGDSGGIVIQTGAADGTVNDIEITAGASATSTGGIVVVSGGAGTPNGHIQLQGKVAILDSNPNVTLQVYGALALQNTVGAVTSLTADDQVVTVGDNSYIRLSSDSAVAANRTFLLTVGLQSGHKLLIEWVGTNAAQFNDDSAVTGGGNVRLASIWLPTQYDTLSLFWNGTDWLETGRSAN